VTPPGSGGYQHWGGPNEPNQARVGLCSVGNASLTYTSAWGWADTMCNNTAVFICRVQRKRRGAVRLHSIAVLLQACLLVCHPPSP
jgi:hypothetical protein